MMTHPQAVQILLHEFSDWFGTDTEHPTFRAAALLLFGLGRRKHLDDLCRGTKYDRAFVREVLRHLRRHGIWRGEDKRTWVGWEGEPLSFVFDAMIGAGVIEQVPEAEPFTYRLREKT